MGCCASRPSRDDDEDDHRQDRQEVAEDRTAQVSRNGGVGADTSPTTQTTGGRRARRVPNLPLSEHYNKPVRLHVWYSKRRIWTRAELDRERREFFETRVTGRPEIWAALSMAITMMRAGDLATAQSIVDAAGITIPTGDLCEGCYDELGALYRLPQCIVGDPENMVKDSSTEAKSAGNGMGQEEPDEGTEALSDGKLATDDASGDELLTEDLERRRDEKGKTSERDLIRVQARLSDRGGPDLMLLVGKGQSVGFLARKVHQEARIPSHQRVRIAYLGRMLKEHESLPDQGWQDGHVVNALIATRAGPS